MSDETIQIPIEAIDEFSTVMDKLQSDTANITASQSEQVESSKEQQKQNESTSLSFTELRSTYSVFMDVLRLGGEIMSETVGITVELANSVRQFRDVTGQTAEESSRLIQVLDDYKISTEDAEKATKKLASEGLQFNIDTLASLSDEFLALNAGQERTKFLYDNFGKSGEKFAELMLLGGDAIREKNAAISESLILGDKQLEQSREYEKNLDDLNDSLLANKVAIGNELLPVLNRAFELEKRRRELAEQGLNGLEIDAQLRKDYIESIKMEELAQIDANKAKDDAYVSVTNLTEGTEELKMSLEELSAKNQELFGLMGDFDSIADTYVEKTTNLKEQEADLLTQKQALIDRGYSAEGRVIQDVNSKLDENILAQQEAAAAAEEAAKRRIAALIETKLSADGLTDEELTALLTLNKEWGLMSESAATAAQQVSDAVNNYLTTGSLDDFTSSVEGITDALLQLPEEKTVKIDVELTVNGQPSSANELFGLLAVEA